MILIYWKRLNDTIPLSYDDSVSYYAQLLCIVRMLNELNDECNNLLDGLNRNFAHDEIVRKDLENTQKTLTQFMDDVEKEVQRIHNDLENKYSKHEKDLILLTAHLEKVENEVKENYATLERLYQLEKESTARRFESLGEKMNLLHDEFTTAFNGVHDAIEALKKFISISQLNLKVELKKYIDEIWNLKTHVWAKNPLTGKVGDLNEILYWMWKILNHALTAQEYASLEITAAQYDALQLTCVEYLTKLDKLYMLSYFNQITKLYNPYVGEFQNMTKVVSELLEYLKKRDGVTTQEYADMMLNAADYRKLKLTPYEYYTTFKRDFLSSRRKGE